MNATPMLWKYQPRRDGRCDVKIYAYLDGKKKYFSTGVLVYPEHWNSRRRRVKNSYPLAVQMNAKIEKKRREIEEMLLSGQLSEKPNERLVVFLEAFIEEAEKGRHNLRTGTIKNYRSALKRLREFEAEVNRGYTFNDIGPEFHREFSAFLADHAGCRLPSQGKHLKIIKRIMNVALARGLHDNQQHQGGGFYVHNGRSSDKIYLTEGEIARLEALDLSHNGILQRELDRFLVAYYFLLRFSDVKRLSREMFFQQKGEPFLRIVHKKTDHEAVIPVKPAAQKLLDGYQYDFSFSSNQDANRHLKTIAAMAGINQLVKQGEETGQKSSFVTTHTARRSAATNLYLNGASLKVIADLGAWKDTEVLRLYLRASGLESARMARELYFFK